jgi:serine/threonine-protein kinase HipA
MNLNKINCCPSTLAPGFTSYSPKAMKDLFGKRSKKISHILSFPAPGSNSQQTKTFKAFLFQVFKKSILSN